VVRKPNARGRRHSLRRALRRSLAAAQQLARSRARKPILAIASHSHFDHVGSHHEFSERACHPAEADIMTKPTDQNTVADLYMNESMITALPRLGYDVREYGIRPAPPTQLLEDGNLVDLGDRVFKVLHLPGHSPGSIGLWEEETGILFSGDAVYEGEFLDQLYHSDVEAYVESMHHLRELPVRVVHCGHYGSLGRERMIELIDGYIASKKAPLCPAEARGSS
jgi:glyoxylase-like metal-dependent hydrolase (beta-lactamase superfamily II)